MDQAYLQRRREIESQFKWYRRNRQESEESTSPSGNFRLTIDPYSSGEDSWAYTRGRVRRAGDGKVIADVKRNFGHFWYSWVRHSNGNEYLLCGEDYQGQTVVNLTEGNTITYFPEAGYEGTGFCWVAAFPSPDSTILAVEGCYWACPYEAVFFDFTKPEALPYKELLRAGSDMECEGWLDNDRFKLAREVRVRKADGRPYDELSEAEQDELDNGQQPSECIKTDVILTRQQMLRGRD